MVAFPNQAENSPPYKENRMEQLWKKIAGLDLKSVRIQFSATRNLWWHFGHTASRIESEYRQFLFLLASNPENTIVPWSQDLADFWFEHRLDKRQYDADCKVIAGR